MGATKRENWSGKLGFVLAVAGSAIGLGNVWKFPYVTGENGGGAFVLVYLLCIVLCGMPIMLCEFAIGRHTRKNPCAAFHELEFGRSPMSWFLALLLLGGAVCSFFTGKAALGVISLGAAFAIFRFGFSAVGFFTIMAAMLILSYYSVIGGWILQYAALAFSGKLAFTDLKSAREVFIGFVSSPRAVMSWHFIFLAITAMMLWGGIRNGIEKWSKILMPLLFLLLVTVIFRSLTLPGAEKGVAFFLSPDFSKLSGAGILEALGHSFYTLSLGMAISITYGSYLAKDQNLFFAAGWVIVVDTAAAMLAGLAIFPAVFAMGFAPDAGPQLIFEVLPATFNSIPGGFGHIWAGLFFVMLTIAALTSAASLLECGVTFLVDEFKLPRKPSIVMCYLGTGLFGILSAVGITGWENIPMVKAILGWLFGDSSVPASWFDLIDYVTSNWMIPLGGLMTCIFVGWVWSSRKAGRELRIGATSYADQNLITWLSGFRGEPLYLTSRNHGLTLLTAWGILVRFVTPVVVAVIFLKAIGVNVGF